MKSPFDTDKISSSIRKKKERVVECNTKFHGLFVLLKNDEIGLEEFSLEFKRILPSDDDSIDDLTIGTYGIVSDYLEHISGWIKELMNKSADSKDSWILESVNEIITIERLKVLDKKVSALMEHQDKWDTLDVENWKLSEKEKEKWWKERQYELGHKRLSKKTLKNVMEYLKDFRAWDPDFKIETLHKEGGLQIYEDETRQEIFKRIENNLMHVPQTYPHTPLNPKRARLARIRRQKGDPDKILIILLLTIIEIKQGRQRVDGILKKFSKLTYHDTKGMSQVEIFYNKYNEGKKHGHHILLQACLQYLTRPMSSKQKTMLRERRGIDSHWASKFTWDYFQAYEKLYGDTDFSNREFGEFNLEYNEKTKELLRIENENVLNELIKCVKKGYIKFHFYYFISLEKNIQKTLIKELEVEFGKKRSKNQSKEEFDDENLNIGQFLGRLREKCREFSVDYITKWADHGDKEEIRSVVDSDSDEFSKIQYMFEWKKNGWYNIRDEGETIEFKSNFYRPPPSIHAEYKKEKKDWEKRKKKDEPFQKENIFTKIKEKEFEIDLMKEICAFLNHKGGKLFFGIEDSTGLVFGIDRDKESKYRGISDKKFRDDHERRIKQIIKNHFGPALGPGEEIKVKLIGPLPHDEKWFVLIDVPATRDRNFDLAKSWSPNGGFSKTKCFVYRDGSNSEWECDSAKYVARVRNTEEESDGRNN